MTRTLNPDLEHLMSDLPEVTARVTHYEVSLLPDGDVNAYEYAITVEYRGDGRWAVWRMGECLGVDGVWVWEPRPSGRDADWVAAHRFGLDTALDLAKAAAPHVTVNGRTAADAYRATVGGRADQ